MKDWEKFEISCTGYLNSSFGKYAQFIHTGGSDSTKPDIAVVLNNGKRFYMEAKKCPAQCGQFVLIPDIKKRIFKYSDGNSEPLNFNSEAIIKHMNNFFDEYMNAGTAGKDICLNNGSAIFSEWIINSYKNRGVRFIITDDEMILPIEKFVSYFEVTACYRIKRSGSGNVGQKNINEISKYLKKNFTIKDCFQQEKKLFISSDIDLHDRRFFFNETEYMISRRESKYEIRRLSNTFNANVIFSIGRKPDIEGLSSEEFISFLAEV